jgi:hypothetical protein
MSKYLDRTVDEVLAWSRSEIRNPTRDWRGMCQSHCRSAYGVQGWSPSAITAWHKIPDAKRNEGGSPEEAPRGAVLYYSGGQFGHAALAAGVRTNGKCLSNDYVRNGRIDYAPRDFSRWGNLDYVGWSAWTPFGSLRLT